jgi:hypothetical protein
MRFLWQTLVVLFMVTTIIAIVGLRDLAGGLARLLWGALLIVLAPVFALALLIMAVASRLFGTPSSECIEQLEAVVAEAKERQAILEAYRALGALSRRA